MKKKNWLETYNKELTEKIESLSKEKESLEKEYAIEREKYWTLRGTYYATREQLKEQFDFLTGLLHKKDETEKEIISLTIERDGKYMSEILYSDVNAYEIVEKKTKDCFLIRELHAEITEESKKELQESFEPGGFCGHFDNDLQEWNFSSDENNPIISVRRHKNGNFYRANSCIPFVLRLEPYKHFDYNF